MNENKVIRYQKIIHACKIVLTKTESMENFAEISSTKKPKQMSYVGKILIGTSAAVAVGISIVCFPFVSPALRRFTLPFIPATDSQLKNILKVLPKSPGKNDRVLDIGSGDGRIVIESAKRGYVYIYIRKSME